MRKTRSNMTSGGAREKVRLHTLLRMKETSTSEKEEVQALHYIDKLGQFPIGISTDGIQQTALIPRKAYDALPHTPVDKPVQAKESWEKECLKCTPPLVPPNSSFIHKDSIKV